MEWNIGKGREGEERRGEYKEEVKGEERKSVDLKKRKRKRIRCNTPGFEPPF
jgi:hypothetical protein